MGGHRLLCLAFSFILTVLCAYIPRSSSWVMEKKMHEGLWHGGTICAMSELSVVKAVWEIQIWCTPAIATHREWLTRQKAATTARCLHSRMLGVASWGKFRVKMIEPLEREKFSFKMFFISNISFWTCSLLLSFHMGTAIVLRHPGHEELHGFIGKQSSLWSHI